ncbi:hypothetical protein [Streptomyces chryseus]|uniref:hypothetical protein n=1 Tax=Streptomyces chryseus TaxID=68186 RepID=UPI00110FF550|nr:hypothetical protein [Streptomyces chryseus]GGX34635.1 hypothetical protein GCM10010353_57100 [Streptomyces chryseus]
MTEHYADVASEPRPAFWYGLPHGYLRLDLDPPFEQVVALIQQVLSLPDELRERAEEVVRFYTGVVGLLNAQQVQGCAIGLHPDETGGAVSSVLTVSTVPASGVNAKLVLASMAGTAADNPDEGMRPLELPWGTGFIAEKKRRTVAPGRPPEGAGVSPEDVVWQGTVAVTGSGMPDIVVVQLVTAAVDLADDYRNVLLGVAHTLSFTDPSPRDEPGGDGGTGRGSAATNAIRNDFG